MRNENRSISSTHGRRYRRGLPTHQPPVAVALGRGGRLYAGGRLLSTPEESDVFAALGLVFIPPIARLGPINEPQRIDPIWNYEEPQ